MTFPLCWAPVYLKGGAHLWEEWGWYRNVPGQEGCCCCCLVTSVVLSLCNPVDCSPLGPSVHEILQARVLEWVVMPSSRGSSKPRDWTWVPCTAGRFFITELPGKPRQRGYVKITGWILSVPTWGVWLVYWCVLSQSTARLKMLSWVARYPTPGMEAQGRESGKVKEMGQFLWGWGCAGWKEWLQIWDLSGSRMGCQKLVCDEVNWILTGKLRLCSHFKDQTFIWVGLVS